MAKRERFFAAFGAALFLVTSSALTVAVILTMSQKNNNNTSNSSSTSQNTSIAQEDLNDGSVIPDYQPQTKALSKIEYDDLQVGTGATVKSGATVKADYVGFLADSGKVFDDSAAHGGAISFPLVQGQVIEGWVLGIPGMKVGGTREILIPAALGYGSQTVTGIPPNSDLGFFVKVESVKNP